MKKIVLFIFLFFSTCSLFAQKKITTAGIIGFDATTSQDRLPKAENKTVIAAIDTKTGTVQFEASVKNFAFESPMMQGHFNSEKWMNSDKFPKFSFAGKIEDLSKVDFTKDGIYKVSVSGNLTIRDITKPITTPGTITVKGNVINASAAFSVKLSDYQITGMQVDAGKVSREPKVIVNADLK
jgi:polyisoprenoid-binding protein YceI